jgi:quercetin dioxygenase-like cupin family protein
MTAGFVFGPGEGPAYGFHGSAVVKASGEDTFGQLGVMESVYPAGLSVHEHVHAGEDEMFYLLDGEMTVFCREDRWTVVPGSFVFVPRDQPHRFTVSDGGPARGAGDHRPLPAGQAGGGPRRTRAAGAGSLGVPPYRAGYRGPLPADYGG